MKVLLLLTPLLLFTVSVWAQNDLQSDVLSKLTYLVENPTHGYPSEEWAKTHVSLRDDSRDIKPVLLFVVENEAPQYGAYALLLLQKRNELGPDTVKAAMSYCDRLYEELSDSTNSDDQNMLMANMSYGFDAIEAGSQDNFPEDYFHKFALSGNDRLAAGSFELLSKYGTDKTIPVLQQSLFFISRDTLKETLRKKYLEPLIAKYPNVPKDIKEPVAEIPATSSEAVDATKVIEEATAPKTVTEEPAEVVITESIEEDIEQPSNWWLWLIGAVVVAGGVFVLRPRK